MQIPMTVLPVAGTMAGELEHEEPAGGRKARMAQKRRSYGSGCVISTPKGLAIRWRETIVKDGKGQRVLRYEALGHVSRKEAAKKLREKLRTADVPRKAPITFEELAREWVRSILPMYKYSTRKSHRHILNKHLLPMFGTLELTQLTRQRVQGFIAELNRCGYAPHSMHHYHEVLNAVLRTAVSWNHIGENPAQGVSLPKLVPKRPKEVLTPKQAADLLLALSFKARTMVALAILSGLRRGELLALRWKAVDESTASIRVSEAVYDGHFDSPKTAAGNRRVPLSEHMLELLLDWKASARRTDPEDLVFGTRNGTPVSSNNLIRRQILPACEKLGLPRCTWLTFRRTYSSWSHQPYKRCHRFFSLHRLRSILCFINNLGNLLAAHGQPQSFQQTGVLIQF